MERLTNSGTKDAKPDVTIREIINRLAEYENLDEQGLIPKLKTGDTVWCIEEGEIYKGIVEKITISRTNGIWFEVSMPKEMPDICAIEYLMSDLNKTVFLIETKAKETLKQNRKENAT